MATAIEVMEPFCRIQEVLNCHQGQGLTKEAVDLSALGSNYNIVNDSSGLLIGVGDELVMTLEGASSL